MASRTFTLNFMGDTMLGRLIDQMSPVHVDEPGDARIARSFQASNANLMKYGPLTPWGNAISLLHSADLNLLNLETSATTHPTKWPNKVFNYRMHPANINALEAAKISYVSLANNHTLDYSEPGLIETVRTVESASIAFAGAGESMEEATRPAILKLETASKSHEIHIWSAADHPHDWAQTPTFHFIDYTTQTRARLQSLLTRPTPNPPSLKIFSVHWGPNYSWQPAREICELAHFLIDSCGVDIIHGHSSHHVQGVEKYKGKLIIYGCGDFVDDYALVAKYRNDLGGIWRVTVEELDGMLRPKRLEVHPTKIERFQARRLETSEGDAKWVRDRIRVLSAEMGTVVDVDAGAEGMATLDLS